MPYTVILALPVPATIRAHLINGIHKSNSFLKISGDCINNGNQNLPFVSELVAKRDMNFRLPYNGPIRATAEQTLTGTVRSTAGVQKRNGNASVIDEGLQWILSPIVPIAFRDRFFGA